jgi:hypothetical protein
MEMTAPTAAAATATAMIEREYRWRMMVSFCLRLTLLQRITFDLHEIGGPLSPGEDLAPPHR